MRIKILVPVFCIVANGSVIAGENNTGCNTELVPKDATSKYIEALQCLNGVVNALQAEVYTLKAMQKKADEQNAYTVSAVNDAQTRAQEAKAEANRAASYAEDANAKIDRLFKKTQLR